MDFDQLFSFLSQDRDWPKKVGIAAVLILTQIGILAVMGWAAEISRRVSEGETGLLPEWDPIGEYFSAGLKLVLAAVVWFLPPGLLVVCQSSLMVFAFQAENSTTLSGLLTAFSLMVYLLVFLYIIAGLLLFSPLYVLVAEGVDLKQLIKPAPAWNLVRENFDGYVITLLVSGLISIILVAVGMVACLVGSFFGLAMGFTFMGILIGLTTGAARAVLHQQAESLPELE